MLYLCIMQVLQINLTHIYLISVGLYVVLFPDDFSE